MPGAPFELLGPRIGHGGLGDVFKARMRMTGQLVAVKFLRERSPANFAHFCREVDMLYKYKKHPFAVRIYEANLLAPTPYFIMELCEGTLADHLGKFTPDQIVGMMISLASILKSIHADGGHHRDIKPNNILLRREGNKLVPVLADFGVANVPEGGGSMTRTRRGTPEYWSPALWNGESYSQADDVYALGISFFEILNGYRQIPAFNWSVPHQLDLLLRSMVSENVILRPSIDQVAERLAAIIELKKNPIQNLFANLTLKDVAVVVLAGVTVYAISDELS